MFTTSDSLPVRGRPLDPSASVVLIVDSHPLFGAALRMALRAEGLEAHQLPGPESEAVLHLAARFPPGVVLLGLDAGGRAPAESDAEAGLIPELIAGLGAQCKPVLVTNSDDDEQATAAAVVAGAVGVIPRTATFETLVDALAGTAAGRPIMTEAEIRYWYGRHRDHERRRGRFAQLVCRLSPREREVLDQLARGCRGVDIASRSMVSISTVRAQIRTILAALEVSTQLEAVALLAGVTRPLASAQPEARREVNGVVVHPIAARRCC